MANFTPNNRRTTNLEIAANAAKILFLIIGIVSTAFLIARFAFPYLLSLLSFSLPKLWNYAISWLSPPYLFFTVHFIIMVIWKLHRSQNPQDVVIGHNSPVDIAIAESVKNDVEMPAEKSSQGSESYPSEIVDKERSADQQLPWPPPEPEPEPEPELKEIQEDGLWPEPEPEPEIKEIQEDGLDATWQAIMNGKSTPVKNQLKKSDTWEKTGGLTGTGAADTQNFKKPDAFRQKRDGDGDDSLIEKTSALTRTEAVDIQKFKKSDTFRQKRDDRDPVTEKREMRKSKTFRESTATAGARAGGGWRGRDALVVGRDELFGRVEAFIKMNYEQMRLQRQESEQRFVEMVNATAY